MTWMLVPVTPPPLPQGPLEALPLTPKCVLTIGKACWSPHCPLIPATGTEPGSPFSSTVPKAGRAHWSTSRAVKPQGMPEVIRPVNWQHGKERPRVGSSQGPAPPKPRAVPHLTQVLLGPARGFSPTRLSTQGSPAMPACPQEGRSDHICQPSWPHLCGTRAALRCPVHACCF